MNEWVSVATKPNQRNWLKNEQDCRTKRTDLEWRLNFFRVTKRSQPDCQQAVTPRSRYFGRGRWSGWCWTGGGGSDGRGLVNSLSLIHCDESSLRSLLLLFNSGRISWRWAKKEHLHHKTRYKNSSTDGMEFIHYFFLMKYNILDFKNNLSRIYLYNFIKLFRTIPKIKWKNSMEIICLRKIIYNLKCLFLAFWRSKMFCYI